MIEAGHARRRARRRARAGASAPRRWGASARSSPTIAGTCSATRARLLGRTRSPEAVPLLQPLLRRGDPRVVRRGGVGARQHPGSVGGARDPHGAARGHRPGAPRRRRGARRRPRPARRADARPHHRGERAARQGSRGGARDDRGARHGRRGRGDARPGDGDPAARVLRPEEAARAQGARRRGAVAHRRTEGDGGARGRRRAPATGC